MSGKSSIKIIVGMTDRDIIIRLKDIFKCGNIRKELRLERKDFYVWSVQKKDHVLEIIYLIEPFMGIRRSKKIQDLLLHSRCML